MFQACVSISACIFYVFMNMYTGYVCINGHTAGEKKKKKFTDLPTIFFSSPLHQHNNSFFLPNNSGKKQDTYDDDEPDKLGVGLLAPLPGDDVPLLRGADNDLGGCDLVLGQLVVTGQLGHCDAIRVQPLQDSK